MNKPKQKTIAPARREHPVFAVYIGPDAMDALRKLAAETGWTLRKCAERLILDSRKGKP